MFGNSPPKGNHGSGKRRTPQESAFRSSLKDYAETRKERLAKQREELQRKQLELLPKVLDYMESVLDEEEQAQLEPHVAGLPNYAGGNCIAGQVIRVISDSPAAPLKKPLDRSQPPVPTVPPNEPTQDDRYAAMWRQIAVLQPINTFESRQRPTK